MQRLFSAPKRLPLEFVSFDFTILSREFAPIGEGEFLSKLWIAARKQGLSGDTGQFWRDGSLTLKCEERTFHQGRVHKEPEIFRICRNLSNRGQTTLAPSDRDILAIGRGAYTLRYDGPPSAQAAHLDLVVCAAETIRQMRPGIVVDHASMLVWGVDGWQSQLKPKDEASALARHLKVELTIDRAGVRVATRGMVKFGIPDLSVEGLPRDVTGIAATYMTSLALDLIKAEGSLDPNRPMAIPAIGGAIALEHSPARGPRLNPGGMYRLLGGVDGESPSMLGLLEVLDRLRTLSENPDALRYGRPIDFNELRKLAQEALPRLRTKFLNRRRTPDRMFLVRVCPPQGAEDRAEVWFSLRDWNESALSGTLIAGEVGETIADTGRRATIKEEQILDWIIFRGGDIEDGGFAMRIANSVE
ncbi:MAG: hypothetical protein BWZ10_03137 [candidate division BRC1 bacterium ADurb.BinA364]|nr:MAG: hypothetical protein BWZ10_03137 [candidate division BRC1 bacterium ADurb.BinA364]